MTVFTDRGDLPDIAFILNLLKRLSAISLSNPAITGGFQIDLLQESAATITAGTTHSLAGATPIVAMNTLVNAANASDAAALPASKAGLVYSVCTVGSTATPAIWPQAADSIDGGTAGASVTLTAAHRGAVFVCYVAGNWVSTLFGAIAS